jgi:hypothetical protein
MRTFDRRPLVLGVDIILVLVKTCFAERKPYVFDTPMGSHMRVTKKSGMIRNVERRRKGGYKRGGRY